MNTITTTDHVVEALVREGLVDAALRRRAHEVVGDALEHGAASPVTGPRRGMSQLVEVVAYLGGALVLAAGTLFLVEEWANLEFAARIGLLAVVTVVLAVAGVVSARVPDGAQSLRDRGLDVRRRLSGTLLVGAALAAAFTLAHGIDHAVDGVSNPVYWPGVAGSAIALVGSVVAYRLAPTALALVGMLGSAIVGTMTLVEAVNTNEGEWVGVTLLLVGLIWLALAEGPWFAETTVARTLGVSAALIGAQIPVIDGSHAWLGYALTVLVAAAGIAVYLTRLAWPYLAAAVLAVTLVVPEAVSDWTSGSLGAVGGVLVAGITLLVASLAGYRLRAETTD